jgi:hypothetical protein
MSDATVRPATAAAKQAAQNSAQPFRADDQVTAAAPAAPTPAAPAAVDAYRALAARNPAVKIVEPVPGRAVVIVGARDSRPPASAKPPERP